MSRNVKRILFLFLFCGGILIGGCETTKCASMSSEGQCQNPTTEVVTPWGALMKLDSWIRENLW